MNDLAPILESFFVDRLIQQRRASPDTIGSYRTTFRLLLNFAQREMHKRPSALDLADLDTQLITAFLTHLEQDRHNSVRTRNARLAAIRSMLPTTVDGVEKSIATSTSLKFSAMMPSKFALLNSSSFRATGISRSAASRSIMRPILP